MEQRWINPNWLAFDIRAALRNGATLRGLKSTAGPQVMADNSAGFYVLPHNVTEVTLHLHAYGGALDAAFKFIEIEGAASAFDALSNSTYWGVDK